MNTIYQFSPGRTGSTLIYNILKDVFPKIIKKHNIHNIHNIKDILIVSTIRDPRDIINSRLRISDKKITKDLIDEEINLMSKFGLDDLISIKDKNNIVILKYVITIIMITYLII